MRAVLLSIVRWFQKLFEDNFPALQAKVLCTQSRFARKALRSVHGPGGYFSHYLIFL